LVRGGKAAGRAAEGIIANGVKDLLRVVAKDVEKDAAKDVGKTLEKDLAKNLEKDLGKNLEKDLGKDVEKGLEKDLGKDASKKLDDRTLCGDPVDVATGEVVMRQVDVELAGVLPLVLSRTHSSSYRRGRCFGPSWSSTLDQRLEVDAAGVAFVADEAMVLHYPRPGLDEHVLPERGPRWPLTLTADGTYAVTQPEHGRTLRFGRVGEGIERPLLSVADDRGNRIDVDRDTAGAPALVRHSCGYRVAVDTDGPLVTGLRLLDPDTPGGIPLVRFGYDADARLVEVVNSSGQPMVFGYDADGRLTGWQDRNGAWYRYVYDDRGRCVHANGRDGYLDATFAYDDERLVTVVTDSLGNATTYHLDERGRVVREVDPLGHAALSEWDDQGRLTARTDPLGRTTRYAYDAAGNLAEVTRPDGTRTRVEYDQHRRPVTVTDADGAVWRQSYDERGNLVAVTDPLGAVTRYTYDQRSRLVAVTDPLGRVHRIECDEAGLPVATVDPTGATTRYDRDAFGRVAAVTDPTGAVTRYGWTVEGRLRWRMWPDGATEQWHHDGEGNLVEYVDALGQVTRVEYSYDQPTAVVGPDGARVEYAYDSELRLRAVTNAAGLVWRYEYDAAGNLVREVDFDGRELTYGYDPAGQVTSRTANGQRTVHFVRDAVGNLVERRHGEDTVATFAYDAAGRMVRAVNADAEVTWERDALGRVVAETVNGRTVVSRYDAVGRRVYRRTPTGSESVWDYGAAGHPVALRVAGRAVAFHHDPAGREVQRLLDTGTAITTSWAVGGRVAAQTVTQTVAQPVPGPVPGAAPGPLPGPVPPQTVVVGRRGYRYRPDGFVSAVEDLGGGTRAFDLDPLGRVTAVRGPQWNESYRYDAAGNVTAVDCPTDPESAGLRTVVGNRVHEAGNVHYRYDEQGRIVMRQRRRLSGGSETWQFTWDADDRLTDVVTPDGARWHYTYDALGRRIGKQRLGPDGAGTGERIDFTWDGTTLAEQVHSAGHAICWEWSPGEHRPLFQIERSRAGAAPQEWIDREFYSIVTDLVGTPTELVDPAGVVAWRHRHTLWGGTVPQAGDTGYTPLRFPGQYYDPETGFHYNYHRYYVPELARYATPDPLGLVPAPNPQSYVGNPLNWADPLGLIPCDPCKSQSDKLPKGDNRWYANRKEAFNAAKDRAGIPRSQSPVRQWEVGNDVMQSGRRYDPVNRPNGNYLHSDDLGSHGRYYQYDTPNGPRVIAEHTGDPRAPHPHFHAYEPKDDMRGIMVGDRYARVDGAHHYYYGPHDPTWPGE
jgi:RHS repeat-associated protein